MTPINITPINDPKFMENGDSGTPISSPNSVGSRWVFVVRRLIRMDTFGEADEATVVVVDRIVTPEKSFEAVEGIKGLMLNDDGDAK